MAQTHVFLNDVQAGIRHEELVCRLIHFWEARNPTKGNTLIGLELLFIDEHGTTIQGFIAPNRIEQYKRDLKPNSIYRLTHFYAVNNKVMFRLTEHKFTLCFTDGTTLDELHQETFTIGAQLFRFHSFTEFEAAIDRKGNLRDAIGHIKLINGQHMHERPTLSNTFENTPGQKSRLTIHLQLKEGPVVNVYLWDSAAAEFIRKFEASNDIPKVLLVTTVNPKRLGGHVSLTSMSPSRVFLDSDVAETRDYLTWLGDNANQLATVNTSEVTKLETLTIAEIMQFIREKPSQVAMFFCVANITGVLRDAGWYYLSCTGCNHKCYRGPKSFICNHCPNQNAVATIKYMVEFLVTDNNSEATFVFLDDAGSQLAGQSAPHLRDSFSKAAEKLPLGEEAPFPACFSKCLGETHTFMVKINEYNFRASRQTITVSKIVDSTKPPQHAPDGTSNDGDTLDDDLAETNTIAETSTTQRQETKKSAINELHTTESAGSNQKRPRHNA